ncbi:DNA adenine methylase [Nautilia sp.]
MSGNKTSAKPFIKWVGGKRGVLSQILPYVPKKFNNYFEPFVGGGALFFELYNLGLLKNKKVYLFDKNEELVNAYKVVKSNPFGLIEKLKEFENKHSKEFYYEIRETDRKENFKNFDPVLRAARFIYLNKTCFNGLYRVNKKGYFNVPIGRYKNPKICDEEAILSASGALKNATVKASDFSEVLNYAEKGDFVYFDPPYYPLNKTSNFTSYTDGGFLEEEQRRLYEVFEKLSQKGVYVLESNSDTEYIKNLYKKYEINFVNVNRLVNSKAGGRGKIKEILLKAA